MAADKHATGFNCNVCQYSPRCPWVFFLQIRSNRLRAASSESGSSISCACCPSWIRGVSPESSAILRFRSSISRASLSCFNIAFSLSKAWSRAQGSSGHWPVSPKWLASRIGSWENHRLEYVTKQDLSHQQIHSVLGIIMFLVPLISKALNTCMHIFHTSPIL